MIIPSLASANPLAFDQEIRRLGGFPELHLDIEDGNFIPNITFGLKTVEAIRKAYPDITLNVHLMTTNPDSYLAPLAALGITRLAMHIEALPYPLASVNLARRLGLLPGLALNFATPVGNASRFVREIDFLLIMTSEPDDQGSNFHPVSIARIREARELLPSGKAVWVDGGIGENELRSVHDAGADTVIMGRAIFRHRDPAGFLAAMNRMRHHSFQQQTPEFNT
jgi:ribulose-phosphate 3-epimerase